MTKHYFTKETEQYISEYLNTEDEYLRNSIYIEHLHVPFTTLVECVYRRFKFNYVDIAYGDRDAIHMGLSFISTLLPKIDLNKGKAYSYLSLCIKNYYIQLNKRLYNESIDFDSIEQITEESSDTNHSFNIPKELIELDYRDFDIKDYTKCLTEYLEAHIDKLISYNYKRICPKIQDRNRKVLLKFIEIFKNSQILQFDTQVRKNASYGKQLIYKKLQTELGLKNPEFRHFTNRIALLHTQLLKNYINTGNIYGK